MNTENRHIEQEPQEQTMAGRKVLLADDSAMNRMLAKLLLESAGAEVMEAADGAEAVALLHTTAFDLVLMDVQMPVMNGLEATRRLRMELHSQVPVIALTANSNTDELQKCREAGMNDCLTKPYTEEQFFEKLSSFRTA